MSDTTDLFLITGATGKTGAPTVELLRQRGFRVRALVHSLDDRASRAPKSCTVICSTSTR
jgi:NAD(P)H dehydrogenase (quinone)